MVVSYPRHLLLLVILFGSQFSLHATLAQGFLATGALVGSAYGLHDTYQRDKLAIAEKLFQDKPLQELDEPCNPEDAPVITLFSHGLGANHKHGKFYGLLGFTTKKLHVFDYRDSSALTNPEHSFIAQDGDIESLKEQYLQLARAGYKVVLYGVSRGAATIVNFLGTYTTKNVIAAVIESPFPTVLSVINSILSKKNLDVIRGFPSLANALFSKFMYKNYDIYGINPLYVAHKIQHDIALFIICSKEDKLIPATETIKVYDALKNKAKHPKVHLLQTELGAHGQIMDFDTNQYLYDVHAFYNYYHKGLGNAEYEALSTHPDFK